MKKLLLFVPAVAALALASCGNKNSNQAAEEAATDSVAQPSYTLLDKEQVDLASFPQDADGYYVIFNGKDFTGWRGYGKDTVPARWTVEDGAIKFNGAGGGEAQTGDGGDIIFAKKLGNFELEVSQPCYTCGLLQSFNSVSYVLVSLMTQIKLKGGNFN